MKRWSAMVASQLALLVCGVLYGAALGMHRWEWGSRASIMMGLAWGLTFYVSRPDNI